MESLILGLCDKTSNFKTLTNSRLYDRNINRIITAFLINQIKPKHVTSRTLPIHIPKIRNIIAATNTETYVTGDDILYFAVITDQNIINMYNTYLQIVRTEVLPDHYYSQPSDDNNVYLLFCGGGFYVCQYLGGQQWVPFPELAYAPVYHIHGKNYNFTVDVKEGHMEVYNCLLYSPRGHIEKVKYDKTNDSSYGTLRILPCNKHADKKYEHHKNKIENTVYLRKKDFADVLSKKTYLRIKEDNFVVTAYKTVIAWNNDASTFSIYEL